MSEVVTWEQIHKEFERRHPHWASKPHDYIPHDYAQIKIYFTDGTIMIYDYDLCVAKIIRYGKEN